MGSILTDNKTKSTLSFATQYLMSRKANGDWATECLAAADEPTEINLVDS